jgi:hypothetical protein
MIVFIHYKIREAWNERNSPKQKDEVPTETKLKLLLLLFRRPISEIIHGIRSLDQKRVWGGGAI